MLTKQEKIQKIKEFFGKTIIDPGVTAVTLNKEYTSISPELLSDTAHKLVRINKGDEESDDRDNMLFSKFLGAEDYVKEHITKDAGKLQMKAKMKMDQKKNLSWLDSGFFSPQIRSVIVGNSLAQNMEGINPIEFNHVAHKLTRLGEGGIPSDLSIPDETRTVSDSSFGFSDPFAISEDNRIGVTTYITQGTRKGNDGKLYKEVYDADRKPVWVDHETLLNSNVEIPKY